MCDQRNMQKIYWQYAWVFTQLDVWIRWRLNFSDMLQWIVISNLCVLQPKLEKQGIYGHAFLTLVIIPQCHSFVILVIKPPFYLPNSSPVEHISMHAYSIGWHLACYHPPMHAYSVGWHLSCYHLPSQPRLLPYFPLVPVNLLHVSSITHICGIFARITVTLKKELVINEIVTYKNILFSLADDLDNAGIATYAAQRIHESGVRCGL